MKLQGDGIVNLLSIQIYPYPSNHLYSCNSCNLMALDGLRLPCPPSIQVVEKTGNSMGMATVVQNCLVIRTSHFSTCTYDSGWFAHLYIKDCAAVGRALSSTWLAIYHQLNSIPVRTPIPLPQTLRHQS